MALQAHSSVRSGFDIALEEFKKTLTAQESANFQASTLEEVLDEIKRMQKIQEQKHMLRGLGKIQPFVDGLTRYAAVIEQFVTIKPAILAAIWGPLKLFLQVSQNASNAFDSVWKTLQSIGNSLPRFDSFAAVFQHCHRVTEVLVWLYKDILELYSEILSLFRKKAWRQRFSLLWSNLGDRFEFIHDNIRQHIDLVDAEIVAADILEAHKFRRDNLSQYQQETRNKKKQRLREAEIWLRPLFFEDEIQRLQDIDGKFLSTGEWLRTDRRYLDWLRSAPDKVLWLSGIPGSGKTVLTYKAWHFLQNSSSTRTTEIALFLTDAGQTIQRKSQTAASILCTIAYQLILKDQDNLLPVLDDLVESEFRNQQVRTRKMCETLLEKLVSATDLLDIYILVDGLDEIDQLERVALLQHLLGLSKTDTLTLRLLISSRDMTDIRTNLKNIPKIVANEKNGDDIRSYTNSARDNLIGRYGLDDTEAIAMLERVSTESEGMFLYARLVLYSLQHQINRAELREAVQSLPKGLNEAYSRIIRQIQALNDNERYAAVAVLMYLICVRGRTRLIEIQKVITINSNDRALSEDKSLRVDLEDLCGPMIETRNGVVAFVHFSAKEYLQTSECDLHLNKSLAHYRMALLLMNYLNFSCFDRSLSNDEIISHLRKGDYLWLDYAQDNWLEHVKAGSKVTDDFIHVLKEPLKLFLTKWSKTPFTEVEDDDTRKSFGLECFRQRSPYIYQTLAYIAMFRSQMRDLEHATSEDPLLLEKFSRRVWTCLEDDIMTKHRSEDHTVETMTKYYGKYYTKPFRCMEPGCPRFKEGFATRLDRDSHSDRHNRPFKCSDDLCEYSRIGFLSRADLDIHFTLHPQIDRATELFSNLHPFEPVKIEISDREQRDLMIRDVMTEDNVEQFKKILASGVYTRLIVYDNVQLAGELVEGIFGCAVEAPKTLLHEAVCYEALTIMELLLKLGMDVNHEVSSGFIRLMGLKYWEMEQVLLDDRDPAHGEEYITPLCLACRKHPYPKRIITLLLGKGAVLPEVDLKSWKCHHPLVAAAAAGNLFPFLQTLLSTGYTFSPSLASLALATNPSILISEEQSNIIGAELTHVLLDCGAKTNLNRGSTMLCSAINDGDIARLRVLLERGANPSLKSSKGVSALTMACIQKHYSEEIVQLLLTKTATSPDPDDSLGYSLGAAARTGNRSSFLQAWMNQNIHISPDVATLALNFSFDSAKDKKVSLHDRILDPMITHWLLDSGAAMFGSTGRPALCSALIDRDIERMRILLERGADVNIRDSMNNNQTPFITAALEGFKEGIFLLLKYNADINLQSVRGMTALHMAVQKSYTRESFDQLLIEVGANVISQDKTGRTALHMINIVRLLIEAGADVNLQDNQGITAVQKAVSKNTSKYLVELFIEAGADINLQDKKGNTALHEAVLLDSGGKAVRLLIEAGADPDIRNKQGKRPGDYTRARRLYHILGITFEELVEKNRHKIEARRLHTTPST